jgi:hypothetical protein
MDKRHLVEQISRVTDEAIFEFPITQKGGIIQERYDSVEGHNKEEKQPWCPSEDFVKDLFNNFSGYQDAGLSPLKYGDESIRKIYVCKGGKR